MTSLRHNGYFTVRARCLLGVMLVVGVACSGEPNLEPGIAARIGGRDIPYQDFTRFLDDIAGDGSALQGVAIATLFESFLDEELLFSLAMDKELLTDGADRAIAASVLLASEDGVEPSVEEVEQYYQDHLGSFEEGERVGISQILVQQEELAQEAWRALENGASWIEVSARMEREYGAVVGSQVKLARDEVPEAFVESVFSLAVGEYTPVLKAEYGYHLFLVEARWPAGLMDLSSARVQIERTIRTERSDLALQRLLEEAKERYNVQVADRNLPFERSTSTGSGLRE